MRRHRLLVAVVGCLLVLAACGSRLSDEERAAVLARGGDGVDAGTGEVSGGDVGSDDGGTGADPGTSDGGDAPSGDTGGDAPSGDGQTAGPSAPASGGCTSSGKASDTGVSGTTIKIGNISTIGGPVPGFGQTGRNGLRAFIAYINSTGGICGRTLEMVTGDDRLDAGTNRSETARLEKVVFAFAGNTTVTDDGGAGSLNGAPDASLAISDARIRAETNFSPNPIDLATGGNGTEKMFAWFKANKGVQTGAVIYPAQASARGRALGYKKDMETAGIDVVLTTEVGITETNYSGFASDVANEEVDLVITALEVNGMARLARAFATEGYFPKVPFYGAQSYGQKFLDVAGEAAETTIIGVNYAIPESSGAATVQAFKTWYPRVNPSQDLDYFAIMGWIAGQMLADGIKAAGPDPTREKVVAELEKLTAYDAGGFVGTINPAQKKFAKCFAILEVNSGRWAQTFPRSGFQC